MGRRSDSRLRMIDTAGELFRRQGYHATALSQVVEESGAPRGSIYFHFPGGKEELAAAVATLALREVDDIVGVASGRAASTLVAPAPAQARAGSAPDDPGTGGGAGFVRALAAVVGERLEDSGYRAGCAIATMVLELAPDVEPVRAGADRVFAHWRRVVAARLEGDGHEPERAAALAALVLSTLEGGLLLARAARCLEPLHTAGEALAALVGEASAGRAVGARLP